MSTPALNPLVEKIRAKHPGAYDDMDDAALTKAILAKYPQYSDMAAPAIQKPQVDMQTGAAPIATSFATQLSNLPRNLWEGSFFGELGNPRVKAAHEARIKAMEAPGMEGVKNTFQAANPIVTNQEGVDWGATAANLLPYAASAKGLRTPDIPIKRIVEAAGGALKGGAERLPIVGPVAKGMIRGGLKSWRASAPDVEIPASKVSSTPPESVSKTSQLQQSKALQNVPVSAVQDKSAILSRLQQIAQQPGTGVSTPAGNGPPLRIAGQAVPADTNLAPALEKSLPQNRVQGKIMQVLRKEGPGMTVGIDRLMESPQLKGISREQVLNAAKSLRDQGKIWHEQTGGGAHPVSYTVALKGR